MSRAKELRQFLSAALFLLCSSPYAAFAATEPPTLECTDLLAAEPLLASVVRKLGSGRYYDISVSGLVRISEARLWRVLGDREPDLRVRVGESGIDGTIAAVLLARLLRSGLFAEVVLEPGARARSLSLRLVENPWISGGTIRGLREAPPEPVLAALIGTPTNLSEPPAEPASALRFRVWRKRMQVPLEEPGCKSGEADANLFARVEDGELKPGLLRGGLFAARARALHWLQSRGYPHAAVDASLEESGALLVDIDEGRLVSFEVRGVQPAIRAEVERTLGFKPGDIFSSQALRRAATRLNDRYPYIDLDIDRPAAGEPETGKKEPSFLDRLRAGRADLGDIYFAWDYREAGDDRPLGTELEGQGSAGNAVELVGRGQVILWLRSRRASVDLDWIQLIRHTPATGFAPGLAATLHLWDQRDRGHLSIDGAFAGNTKRAGREAGAGSDLLERMSAQEEIDWLAGARLALPSLSLAELGGQIYALTDTNDTWRMSDTNSYIHSALAATPDREYFRRAGASFLATFHLFDQLTLGSELHHDRYDPLRNPRVWSLANGDKAPQATAPVTPGELGSILFRAEWSSDPIPLLRVGKLYRHPETSLSNHANEPGPGFISMATLEIGNGTLGSDPGIDYLHMISDSRLQLDLGHELLTRVRLRVGLGNGLPLQKQEALGGWSALRGYDFKEFRGDASVLGNIEARWHWAGAFVDMGTVHEPGGWAGFLPGAGAQLFLYRIGSLEVAWRLDGHGSLVPSARALLGWDL